MILGSVKYKIKCWNNKLKIKQFIKKADGVLHVDLPQRDWEGKITIIFGGVAQAYIKNNCNFRDGLQLRCLDDGKLEIGEGVFTNTNVSITCKKNIVIGDRSKIANNVVIIDHDHDFKNNNKGYINGQVLIDNDVWIGANCTILKDTHIGEHSVIGANTVVKGDIPPYSIVVAEKGHIIKNFREK
jgi:acetyltransferase-like isoleucine patch superfamily enzyme